MRALLVVSVLALSLGGTVASGEESNLCANDYGKVCEGYEPKTEPSAASVRNAIFKTPESLRELETISKAMSNRSFFGGPEDRLTPFNRYKELMGKVNEAVLAQAAKRGISGQDLETHLDRLKSSMIERLKTSPQFRGHPDSLQYLHGISFLNASRIGQGSDREVNGFFDTCGVDGMEEGAAYDPLLNSVVLCPGFILKQLRLEGLESMDFVVTHELGHAVRPHTRAPAKVIEPLKPLVQCIEKNYGSEFSTLQKAKEGLQNTAVPALERCLERALKETPDAVEDIALIRTRLDAVKSMVRDYDRRIRDNDMFSIPDTGVSTHVHELGADCLGDDAIATTIASRSPGDRARILRSQLNLFCPEKTEARDDRFRKMCGALVPPGWQDGEHPRDSFRMLNLLKNPRIRAALDCKTPIPSEKPYCGLAGEANGDRQRPQQQQPQDGVRAAPKNFEQGPAIE